MHLFPTVIPPTFLFVPGRGALMVWRSLALATFAALCRVVFNRAFPTAPFLCAHLSLFFLFFFFGALPPFAENGGLKLSLSTSHPPQLLFFQFVLLESINVSRIAAGYERSLGDKFHPPRIRLFRLMRPSRQFSFTFSSSHHFGRGCLYFRPFSPRRIVASRYLQRSFLPQ